MAATLSLLFETNIVCRSDPILQIQELPEEVASVQRNLCVLRNSILAGVTPFPGYSICQKR